jgi:selenocysteine-specific elongation factor
MRVIGTAGHVDHGKSTLVKALTGVHPDRLKEEREREMTIDLGFAWLTLPDNEEIGIVDVPGHRDFIENMLAGVGGIDAALFVIAADEGVMPQTREHLAILDILQIQGGVVVLTKVDLVDDPDWLDLVEEDVRQKLIGTVLEESPIVRVSSTSGDGINNLEATLADHLAEKPTRHDYGRPRLPVDRVFSIAGFGTVVTGTLLDGQFNVGDEIEILPTGHRARIRGLQTHRKKELTARPGSRTAVNISGINTDQVLRGNVIAHPGDYHPSRRIDVQFRLLPDANISLKHNCEVKLFVGAAEFVARVRVIGVEEVKPGDEGWLQLETIEPVVVMRGDHYILRRPSPGETLGGGKVIDPFPKRRYKRFSKEVLSRFRALSQGIPTEILLQAVIESEATSIHLVAEKSALEPQEFETALSELVVAGDVLVLAGSKQEDLSSTSPNIITSYRFWQLVSEKVVAMLRDYHQRFPLRLGMPREELKNRVGQSSQVYNLLLADLVDKKEIDDWGKLIALPTHVIKFSSQQSKQLDVLNVEFERSKYSPPSVKDCQTIVGDDVYSALIDLGNLVQVSPDVVFRKDTYEEMVSILRDLIIQSGSISAAQFRDHFATSRKYALAFLEYTDSIGITIREGDVRILTK